MFFPMKMIYIQLVGFNICLNWQEGVCEKRQERGLASSSWLKKPNSWGLEDYIYVRQMLENQNHQTGDGHQSIFIGT